MKAIIIILTCCVLFIQNLGGIALWDPDEPRQAIMAREMMDRKDYIHPYLNGKPYLEKPPFYPWMIIAASKLKGTVSEFSSRLPAALSATLLVLITYLLGCSLANPLTGFLSALILALNYQFLSNARESVMDMTFACFIGLTIFINYICITKGKRFLFMLSFIPAALGILTKGPAGLVLPALVTFFYLISRKELKRFILPLTAGCIISAALSSIWFFLAGQEYIKEFIFRQNLTRYTNAFDHIETLYYYFHKLFINFLPWSILLLFAIYHAIKRKIWFPFIWFIVIFLFFEFSTSKRAIYLLSCYPACALLCGIYIKDKWSWLLANPITNILIGIFAFLLFIMPISAVFVLNTMSLPVINFFKQESPVIYFYITVLILTGGIFLFSAAKKSYKITLSALFFYFVVTAFFYSNLYMPVMDKNFKSPRMITEKIGSLKEGKDVYTYGFSSAGIIFYVGKPIQIFSNINEIKDKKNDILLIVEDEQSQHMEKDLNLLFLPVRKARYEKENYTIYVRKDGR
ncbi:MAG: glycosyltransferase family 39 protein [Proteobacteria bacterium]|nr:glycosyltransferase family 39 protein [Pseudomonadota bacterium]